MLSGYNSVGGNKNAVSKGMIPGTIRYIEFASIFGTVHSLHIRRDKSTRKKDPRVLEIAVSRCERYTLIGRFQILPKQWRPINRGGRVKSNEIVWNGSASHSRWQHVKYKSETDREPFRSSGWRRQYCKKPTKNVPS